MAKDTALVTLLPVPVSETLFTVSSALKLVAVIAPVKLAVPPMFCKVSALMLERLVPVTLAFETLAPVAKVKLLEPPVTAPKVILPVEEVACVFNDTALPKVTAPKVSAALEDWIVPFKVTVLPTLLVLKPPV